MNNSSISNNFWTARILALFVLVASIILFTGCSSMQNTVIRDMEKIQFGVASYYGEKFHGNKTACGETYDMNDLTAAHRVLPFGTLVKVTNTKNGRAVIVKVNDRGPHKASRVIDLSYAAAQELGMIADGIIKVRLDVIDQSLAADDPLNGLEFEGCLAIGNAIYKDKLPIIQLYSPFESPHIGKNPPDKGTILFRINNELSRLDNMNLSGYIAGNSGF